MPGGSARRPPPRLDRLIAAEATVVWDGRLRSVEIDAVDTPALLGMSLLERYELHIQVVTGGQVSIRPLP